MGNCQAAEAATVVIQRPNGGAGAGWTVERIHWSVSVQKVMASNPGHYVASVTTVSAGPDGAPVRHLKLLRPNDTLHIGHVYRLVSFQEVLKEFSGKKFTKLGKLLAMQKVVQQHQRSGAGAGVGGETKMKEKKVDRTTAEEERQQRRREQGAEVEGAKKAERSGGGGSGGKQRQWRPALHSIAEVGS